MKDIKGYEGLYAITREGKVWSHPRIIIKKDKRGILTHFKWKGRWMRLNTTKKGDWYYSISLSKKGRKGFKVHRLVAQAFIPNPKKLLEINHINGIKTDNRVENLEWCTRKQNLVKGMKTLPNIRRKHKRGEDNPHHKLTEKDVKTIRMLIKKRKSPKSHDISCRKLAKIYGVSSPTIQGIVRGIYWKSFMDD